MKLNAVRLTALNVPICIWLLNRHVADGVPQQSLKSGSGGPEFVLRERSFFSLVVPRIFTLIDHYQLYLSTGAVSNFIIAASMLYFVRTFFFLKFMFIPFF